MLVEGESGTGKTALLAEFEGILKKSKVPHSLINFRNASCTPIDIIDTCMTVIGRVHCAGLREVLNAFGQPSNIVITDNQLTLGAKITVDATLNLKSTRERYFWYRQFTTALFEDLGKAPERCYALLLDTFEQSSDMVQSWLNTHLLPMLRTQHKLLVVISGQTVPGLDTEWERCYQRLHLSGIELDYWKIYAQAAQVQLPHPEWLKAWYFLFKGKPAAMVSALAALST